MFQLSLSFIIKEYFRSPYVWWELFLFVTEKLEKCSAGIEDLRGHIWNTQLEFFHINLSVIIVIVLPFIATILIPISLLKEIKQYFRIGRKNKIIAIIFLVGLYLILLAESIPVLTDIRGIMGHQIPDAVPDKNYFNFLLFVNLILTIFVIPANSINFKFGIKRMISKCIKIPEEKEMNTEKIIPLAWISFIIFLIGLGILRQFLGCYC